MIQKTKKQSQSVSKKVLTDRLSISLSKKRISLTKTQIEVVISEFLEEVKKALIKGEELRFPSYFSFKVTITKPRMGMNLQTGKKMSIPAKRVPKVKFSSDLKTEIAKKK